MNKTVSIFKSISELSDFFAFQLIQRIKEIPADGYCSVALSGGSTPRQLFSHLASNFRESIDWKRILIFWEDERCVPPDSDESNYRMAKESLLENVPIPAENIFRIQGEADPAAEAKRYGEIIRKHVPSVNNIPEFDFMMLGLGEDGHTASIFPGNLHLFSSDLLCEVAMHPVSKQKRVTATGMLINSSYNIIFLVTGKSKAEMVSNVIEHKNGWEKLPASHVQPINGKLYWLLDENAAVNLYLSDK